MTASGAIWGPKRRARIRRKTVHRITHGAGASAGTPARVWGPGAEGRRGVAISRGSTTATGSCRCGRRRPAVERGARGDDEEQTLPAPLGRGRDMHGVVVQHGGGERKLCDLLRQRPLAGLEKVLEPGQSPRHCACRKLQGTLCSRDLLCHARLLSRGRESLTSSRASRARSPPPTTTPPWPHTQPLRSSGGRASVCSSSSPRAPCRGRPRSQLAVRPAGVS